MLMAFSGGGEDTNSTGGAPSACAADPASGTATCRTCHGGAPLGNLSGVITSNIPSAGYAAGATYTITANFVRASHTKFGFEISPQNSAGTQKGTMANITSGTQIILSGKYITHTSSGVSGSGNKIWNFKWTAPASGQGPVTFYGAFNATNNNNSDIGDSIFKTSTTVTEDMAGVQNYDASYFSFSAFPNPTTDKINVHFTLMESSSVEMDLFDIYGNNIRHLFSETDMNGAISKSFDVSSFPKGIYFLLLNVDGNISLQKIVKM